MPQPEKQLSEVYSPYLRILIPHMAHWSGAYLCLSQVRHRMGCYMFAPKIRLTTEGESLTFKKISVVPSTMCRLSLKNSFSGVMAGH